MDLIAKIRLLSEEEGGRRSPTPPDQLRCILEFEQSNFDCVLELTEVGPLAPGQEAQVPIALLVPELVKGRLYPGARFRLRDYRVIGEGEVCEVVG